MKKVLIALLALLASFGANAQEFVWDVDFGTIFDNREGQSKLTAAKTFFLTQLSPEIGLSMLNGEHTVMVGATWTQPIGSEWDGYRISPTAYYMYHKNGLSGFLGMFPRERLYKKLPDYIWNDSVYYVQHNIRGAGIVNVGRHGWFQAIVDWRGMQNKKQREAFNIIAMGEWQKSPHSLLSFGGVAMMNHLAKTEDGPDDEYVVDNLLYNPYVALDFHNYLPKVDSLSVRVGALGSMTRDRSFGNKWRMPVGLWLEANFRWRWLGARQEFYAGGKLFPFYSTYGALLDQGEPYYASKCYSRTELQGWILDKSFVSLRASLDFNVAGGDLMFYQRIILNVKLDGSLFKKKADKPK